jgi:hypothetical protein
LIDARVKRVTRSYPDLAASAEEKLSSKTGRHLQRLKWISIHRSLSQSIAIADSKETYD